MGNTIDRIAAMATAAPPSIISAMFAVVASCAGIAACGGAISPQVGIIIVWYATLGRFCIDAS